METDPKPAFDWAVILESAYGKEATEEFRKYHPGNEVMTYSKVIEQIEMILLGNKLPLQPLFIQKNSQTGECRFTMPKDLPRQTRQSCR